MLSILMLASIVTTPGYSVDPYWGQIISPSDNVFTLEAPQEYLIKVHRDGAIEYGPHYTPDAAAKAFWKAVSQNAPCKGTKP